MRMLSAYGLTVATYILGMLLRRLFERSDDRHFQRLRGEL